MLRNDVFSAVAATCYLVLYCILLQFESTRYFGVLMFFVSPVIVCWMVYTVLKHGKYDGRELGEEEFGYHDKAKDELGVF